MKKGLGEHERLLFAYVQMRKQTTVRTGELAGPLQLSAPRERDLLSRLAKAGWIARVKRGLYLVPPRLPLGGSWTPTEATSRVRRQLLVSNRRAYGLLRRTCLRRNLHRGRARTE